MSGKTPPTDRTRMLLDLQMDRVVVDLVVAPLLRSVETSGASRTHNPLPACWDV